jgi:hypothetical protein
MTCLVNVEEQVYKAANCSCSVSFLISNKSTQIMEASDLLFDSLKIYSSNHRAPLHQKKVAVDAVLPSRPKRAAYFASGFWSILN